MTGLRYYCKAEGSGEILKLLKKVRTRQNIPYEVLDLSSNGAYDEEKEKRVYERDFKPRAKILKKRTGESITRLRSRKARHYYVSTPGTIAVVRDGKIEWYDLGDEEIEKFLKLVLDKGHAVLEGYCVTRG